MIRGDCGQAEKARGNRRIFIINNIKGSFSEMAELYSVSLGDLITEFNLQTLYMPDHEIRIDCMDVNRPGLCLAGFFDHFEPRRIEIIGNVESLYIRSLPIEKQKESIDLFLSHSPRAVVVTRNLPVEDWFVNLAAKYDIPLLHSSLSTSEFMAALISSLCVSLAPRITRHGVLVEIYGEGVMLTGDSGIGKSETAIELVKRGHRLIADDAVEIKKVSAKTLVGSAPELIRHYIELRGIGIVDVRRLFGMGAVKMTEKIDLIVALEPWDSEKDYDRFGLETECEDVMGIMVPKLTIPVKPGRNLAIILEIAAMNHRQKKMGYNTAEEFNKRLMAQYESQNPDGSAN